MNSEALPSLLSLLPNIFGLCSWWYNCENVRASDIVNFFYGRFSPGLGILFYNQIKFNLSIYNSNQTWDSSQLCIFESKPGVE